MKQGKIHDVYWGSHGCKRRKGHANPCRCECGEWYRDDVYTYGDDKGTAVGKP